MRLTRMAPPSVLAAASAPSALALTAIVLSACSKNPPVSTAGEDVSAVANAQRDDAGAVRDVHQVTSAAPCQHGEFVPTEPSVQGYRARDVVAAIMDVRPGDGGAFDLAISAGANVEIDGDWTGLIIDHSGWPIRGGMVTVSCTARVVAVVTSRLDPRAVPDARVRMLAPVRP